MCTRIAHATLFSLALIALAHRASGDTIIVEGVRYDDVYILEGANRYYVQVPEDGRVLSFERARVAPEEVILSQEEAHREALRQQWREANRRASGEPIERPARARLLSHRAEADAPPRQKPSPEAALDLDRAPDARVSVSESQRAESASEPTPVIVILPPADPQAIDGYLKDIRLRDLPLREALDALLRPLSLSYKVQGHFIWISTPERLRTEPFEDPEVRSFALERPGGETLPKVGVANLGGTP